MNQLVVWLVILVAVAGPAGAATYYVDSEIGHDDATRNGAPLDPWRTITYALSRVSGENTFMCRGTFEEDVLVAYDDRGSELVGNPRATLDGRFICGFEGDATLNVFDVYGYAGGGSKSGIYARGCRFNNPSGGAFAIARFHGYGGAYDCVFEDCKTVMGINGFEFGAARFSGCTVKDCGNGISYSGEATVSATSCRFENVAGTAYRASIWGESASVSSCVVTNCGTGVSMTSWEFGGGGWIADSTFKYNEAAITVAYEVKDWGGIGISGNLVTENGGPGIKVGGVRIKVRKNVVTGNYGHGVYIESGAPDLGIPKDPGGNTFGGNKSGYDVYNASPENVPAYGNTWDPRSEREMEGKTWQEVNVTRIYDHWDNPKFGYVMWSKPVAVAPASLGQIKASFREGSAPALSPPGSAAADR